VCRLLDAMRIPVLAYPGYEADDVIGSIARREAAAGVEVVIVSSDKDLLQLVTDRVSMLNPAKDDEWYDAAKVREFLGVAPAQVADLLALKGDAVDNIPGAPGIGDKGARELIEQFGSVEAAIAHAADVPKRTYRESLQNNVDRILMSKRLATIVTDVPIEFSLADAATRTADSALLKAVYADMEFHSLLKDLGPSEDARVRDYAAFADAAELRAWLAAVPPGAPVAVAISKAGEGELSLDSVGLAWKPGQARAASGELIAALKPWLEDAAAPKIACDVNPPCSRSIKWASRAPVSSTT
jgi:DNA polymerase-1